MSCTHGPPSFWAATQMGGESQNFSKTVALLTCVTTSARFAVWSGTPCPRPRIVSWYEPAATFAATAIVSELEVLPSDSVGDANVAVTPVGAPSAVRSTGPAYPLLRATRTSRVVIPALDDADAGGCRRHGDRGAGRGDAGLRMESPPQAAQSTAKVAAARLMPDDRVISGDPAFGLTM